jgi:hypothetical protein
MRASGFVCSGYSFAGDARPSISWTCSRGTAVVSYTRG